MYVCFWISLLDALHEPVNKLVVFLTSRPLLMQTEIKLVVEEIFVLSHVNQQLKLSAKVNNSRWYRNRAPRVEYVMDGSPRTACR